MRVSRGVVVHRRVVDGANDRSGFFVFLVVLRGGSLEQTGHSLVNSVVVRTPVGINSVQVWGLQTRSAIATAVAATRGFNRPSHVMASRRPRGRKGHEQCLEHSPEAKAGVGQCGSVQVVLQGPAASDIRDGIHQIKQTPLFIANPSTSTLSPHPTLLSLLSPARPSSTKPVTTGDRL